MMTRLFVLFAMVLLATIPMGYAGAQSAATETIGFRGILHRSPLVLMEETTPSAEQQKKKEVAERLDRENLLYSGKIVEDKDRKMLEPPAVVAAFAGRDYQVAEEPPTVEFGVIPVTPVFLEEPRVKSKSDIENTTGPWANWGQATQDPRTGKYYGSVGDDGKYGGRIHIVEYDAATKTMRVLPEINRVLGRSVSTFGDGKIHGWLNWYQSDQIDSPHLWFCTYWTKYPQPDDVDFESGYDGGHILSMDVVSGDIVDYGAPVKRSAWPYHRVDTKRGILYAVGMFGEFLAWDINAQKTLFAGYLPDNMGWWERALLIDEVTGMVYTSNRNSEADPELHLVKYDPDRNRFSKLECHVPATTGSASNKGTPGSYSAMRAQTADRGPDGLFWCVTIGGQLFTFDPVAENVEDKGPNWPGEQRYTASMARSPGGRYVYYIPGAHGHGYSDGSPLVQYDTQTGRKKVLAFFFPYYYEKYGYTLGGTFSIHLDAAGARLFVVWNGAFIEHTGEPEGGDTFGQCSLMLVHIPESERAE